MVSSLIEILNYRAFCNNINKTAFVYLEDGENETQSITFSELALKSKRIAGNLQGCLNVNDRALLLFPHSSYFIEVILGCQYAGIIPVPTYPPNNEITYKKCLHIIKDAEISAIITSKKTYGIFSNKYNFSQVTIPIVFIDDFFNALSDCFSSININENNVALLQYTSGSTNSPKGVVVTHKNLLTNIEIISKKFELNENMTLVSWLPFFHDMGLIGNIFATIYSGIKMITFSPVSFLQKPARWLNTISRYNAQISGGPNFAYDLCVERITDEQLTHIDLSSWEQAFCGAEPIKAATFKRFSDKFHSRGFKPAIFYPTYGLAEVTLMATGGKKGNAPNIINVNIEEVRKNKIVFEESGISLVGCGECIPGHKINIVNPESQKSCKKNEIGEIWLSGNSVAKGYWNKDIETNETFKAKIENDSDEYLRTGDLGVLINNELFITGRLKEVIIINGLNYYPNDIEQSIENCDSRIKKNCCATFSTMVNDTEALVAVAEIDRNAMKSSNHQEIVDHIKETISREQNLTIYSVVLLPTGKLPKTTSGKIQRKKCKKMFEEDMLPSIYTWKNDRKRQTSANENHQLQEPVVSFSQLKHWLIEKASQTLNIPKENIDPEKALHSYGIDSLTASKLSDDLGNFTGTNVSPTIFYDYPSITQIGNFLLGKRKVFNNGINTNRKNFPNSIAVIGMACRFPNAPDIDKFWKSLVNSECAISDFPKERGIGEIPMPRGGYLQEVKEFDYHFFDIARHEAIQMDPQQRLLLEVTWEAFENSGIDISGLFGSGTGVFIGISNNDYKYLVKNNHQSNVYSATGNAFSIAANRISYCFNFKGPSIAVDTACSSSLVATHLAVKSLRANECDIAIAGGVNLILDAELTNIFKQAGMLSEDFLCKTFDASANGYVRGEGCGVLVLKPLQKAIANNDQILAVIKGSAVNQDGSTNGLTSPNGPSQELVIQAALADANITSHQLSYIEAHGTGTSLGDPIEVNSLTNVLKVKGTSNPCHIGSVKSNIGHLESAAGVAGLIKTILSLKNKTLPATINYHTLNPLIKIENSPVTINNNLITWDSKENKLYAGVSSFGFGGTNAHVILEEPPKITAPLAPVTSPSLLAISGKTREALQSYADKYIMFLKDAEEIPLTDICYTSTVGRKHFPFRQSFVGNSISEISNQIYAFANNKTLVDDIQPGCLAFIFTGQGSQYFDMGHQLYLHHPVFKKHMDECKNIMSAYLQIPLDDLIFNEHHKELIHQTLYTQPALFAIEYSLAQYWISLGIVPQVVLGHSLGEYVAACIARVFSLQDAIKLVCHRAQLMNSLEQNGAMYGLFINHSEIDTYLFGYTDYVSVAAINEPGQVVISGEMNAIASIVQKCTMDGVHTKKLEVSHAFHSPLMKPILMQFEEIAKSVAFRKPSIQIISNITGELEDNAMLIPTYWVNHIMAPVNFYKSIITCEKLEINSFLEIGPAPVLTSLSQKIIQKQPCSFLYSFRNPRTELTDLYKSVGALYNLGYNIKWDVFHKGNAARKTILPSYPFQRKQCWIESNEEHTGSILNLTGNSRKKELMAKIQKLPVQLTDEEKKFLPRLIDILLMTQSEQIPELTGLIYESLWIEKKLDSTTAPGPNQAWLIVSESQSEAQGFSYVLSYQKISNEILYIDHISENTIQLLSQKYNNCSVKVIYLFSGNLNQPHADVESFGKTQIKLVYTIKNLVLKIVKKMPNQARFYIVTQNAQLTGKLQDTTIDFLSSIVWGGAKSLSLEFPELFGSIINFSGTKEHLFHHVVQEITQDSNEQFVHYENGKRFLYRIDHHYRNNEAIDFVVDKKGAYVITGGLGSIGMEMAEWLSLHGASEIYLINRTANISDVNRKRIEKIKQRGTHINIERCDIRSYRNVCDLFKKINSSGTKLIGIINAAGIGGFSTFEGINDTDINDILLTKTMGTYHIFNHIQQQSVDLIINFSSISSAWGSKGQFLYAAANQFLDCIMPLFKAHCKYAISINWGPWAGSNMFGKNLHKTFQKIGITGLVPNTAIQILEYALSNQLTNCIVADVDWSIFKPIYEAEKRRPVFELIRENAIKINESSPIPKLREELKNLSPEDQKEKIVQFTQNTIAQLLGNENSIPGPNQGFFEMGLDSLMAIELKNILAKQLGLPFPNTLLFEYSTIHRLADYILQEIKPIPRVEFIQSENIKVDISNLSTDEIASLLVAELENNEN